MMWPTCASTCCRVSRRPTRTMRRTASCTAPMAPSIGSAASSSSRTWRPRGARRRHSGATGMYRFDPRRFTFGFHAPIGPNPHGISFDYWGYHFATDGTSGNPYQVVPSPKGFKMRELFKKTVRPVPASGIMSSQQFPPENQQNFIICNVIGFLGIKQYRLERNPTNGLAVGVEVENAGPVHGQELPPLRFRVRRRWRALHRRLAQHDHRPHAAQRARPQPRPSARPHLSHDRNRPPAAGAGEDRGPAARPL
jgi:hypothetical protein